MNSFIIEILKELLTAWRDGTRKIRATISTSIVFVVIAIIVLLVGKFLPYMRHITEGIAGALGIIGGVLALTIFAFQKAREEEKQDRHLEQVEKRHQENPQNTDCVGTRTQQT